MQNRVQSLDAERITAAFMIIKAYQRIAFKFTFIATEDEYKLHLSCADTLLEKFLGKLTDPTQSFSVEEATELTNALRSLTNQFYQEKHPCEIRTTECDFFIIENYRILNNAQIILGQYFPANDRNEDGQILCPLTHKPIPEKDPRLVLDNRLNFSLNGMKALDQYTDTNEDMFGATSRRNRFRLSLFMRENAEARGEIYASRKMAFVGLSAGILLGFFVAPGSFPLIVTLAAVGFLSGYKMGGINYRRKQISKDELFQRVENGEQSLFGQAPSTNPTIPLEAKRVPNEFSIEYDRQEVGDVVENKPLQKFGESISEKSKPNRWSPCMFTCCWGDATDAPKQSYRVSL